MTLDGIRRTAGALFTCALIFGMFSDAASAPADPDRPLALVPHRAIYDLSLQQTRGNSSISAVRGRILYDFSGSACDGYSLTFRQVSELNSREGKESTSDLRSTTWEGADAKRFKFKTQNFVDGNLVNSVDGHADHDGKITAVDLRRPEHKAVDIGGRLVFPTEHMVRAIEAARAGKNILSFPVYDGSENGEKVYNTMTLIGRPIAPDEKVPTDAAAGQAALAGLKRWPVTISYFDRNDKARGEQTPVYSISFELYENGISRALSLDYEDFVVAGEMSQLEIKDPPPCK